MFEYEKIKGHIMFLQDEIVNEKTDLKGDSKGTNDDINKTQKSLLQSTRQRYKNYVESYNYFTQTENLSNERAEKKTCEKHGISSKTLLRAIRAT